MTGDTSIASHASDPLATAMSPGDLARFVAQPWIAVLSWVTPKGEVTSTPVWQEYRDGKFLVHSMSTSQKNRAILRNANVSLCIQDPAPPYRAVTVRAQARVIDDAKAGFDLDQRLARRYLGRAGGRYYIQNVYPTFSGESRILELTPTSVSSFDGSAGINPAAVFAMRAMRKLGV
ncbi:MAG: pyridoxamine 5'-phosphate oxidase family protein [Dehalococcoidia bacterium]